MSDSPDPEVRAYSEATPPAKEVEEQQRELRFQQTLLELTPNAYVTPVLIALNVAVFVLMVATGVDAMSPRIDHLLQWGANYAPKTVNAPSTTRDGSTPARRAASASEPTAYRARPAPNDRSPHANDMSTASTTPS